MKTLLASFLTMMSLSVFANPTLKNGYYESQSKNCAVQVTGDSYMKSVLVSKVGATNRNRIFDHTFYADEIQVKGYKFSVKGHDPGWYLKYGKVSGTFKANGTLLSIKAVEHSYPIPTEYISFSCNDLKLVRPL